MIVWIARDKEDDSCHVYDKEPTLKDEKFYAWPNGGKIIGLIDNIKLKEGEKARFSIRRLQKSKK
jgi:hypothetical protein